MQTVDAGEALDVQTEHFLTNLWHHRTDAHLPLVELVERITEARRRLREPLSSRAGVRELLYLDLASEESPRAAAERNIHLHLSGDQLVELTGRVLENLVRPEPDSELAICSRHWERLKGTARFSRLHLAECHRTENLSDRGLGRLGTGHDLHELRVARWMGANGRCAAETAFTWDAIAEKTEECYRSV